MIKKGNLPGGQIVKNPIPGACDLELHLRTQPLPRRGPCAWRLPKAPRPQMSSGGRWAGMTPKTRVCGTRHLRPLRLRASRGAAGLSTARKACPRAPSYAPEPWPVPGAGDLGRRPAGLLSLVSPMARVLRRGPACLLHSGTLGGAQAARRSRRGGRAPAGS